jgi:hypothetical protein
MFTRHIRNEVVFVANGILEAETVRILLESFEIPAHINQVSAGIAYGLSVGPMGEVDVLVPTKYEQDAKKIIAAMMAGELEEPDAE